MTDLSQKITEIKELINDAEYIVIGAGAGLSSAAGLTYEGKRFEENFSEFIEKYNMTDMYSAGFYPFESEEEKWAYWSKHIQVNIEKAEPADLYKKLFELVKDKNYFVITTNVDDQFTKSGFPSSKVFATQGSYSYFQCSKACHNKLYKNTQQVRTMVENIDENLRVPTELLPVCPECGEPLETNLRKDNFFVEDDYWHLQNKAYNDFIENAKGRKTLLLEFGIGFNTPVIIRFPFEAMTSQQPEWTLVRFNRDYLQVAINVNNSYKLITPEQLNDYKLPNDFNKRYMPISDDVVMIIDELLK